MKNTTLKFVTFFLILISFNAYAIKVIPDGCGGMLAKFGKKALNEASKQVFYVAGEVGEAISNKTENFSVERSKMVLNNIVEIGMKSFSKSYENISEKVLKSIDDRKAEKLQVSDERLEKIKQKYDLDDVRIVQEIALEDLMEILTLGEIQFTMDRKYFDSAINKIVSGEQLHVTEMIFDAENMDFSNAKRPKKDWGPRIYALLKEWALDNFPEMAEIDNISKDQRENWIAEFLANRKDRVSMAAFPQVVFWNLLGISKEYREYRMYKFVKGAEDFGKKHKQNSIIGDDAVMTALKYFKVNTEDPRPMEIKKAYRKQVMKWHPDRWTQGTVEEQGTAVNTMLEINDHAAVLKSKDLL